jgi:hypothetical protein
LRLLCSYWSEALSFGVMDACLWPGFCKELKLQPQGWTSQLPAVVRYVRGKEQDRLPAPGTGDELGLRPNFISQVLSGWSQSGSCSLHDLLADLFTEKQAVPVQTFGCASIGDFCEGC